MQYILCLRMNVGNSFLYAPRRSTLPNKDMTCIYFNGISHTKSYAMSLIPLSSLHYVKHMTAVTSEISKLLFLWYILQHFRLALDLLSGEAGIENSCFSNQHSSLKVVLVRQGSEPCSMFHPDNMRDLHWTHHGSLIETSPILLSSVSESLVTASNSSAALVCDSDSASSWISASPDRASTNTWKQHS